MRISAIVTWTLLIAIIGCGKPSDDAASPDAPVVMDELPPMFDEPGHPDHGPHGGELIELGREDFHAELVHSQDGIAIFVLDSSATAPVAIGSDTLTVSLKREGEVTTFDLAAHPDAGDAIGQSSRFTSSDPQLAQWIDAGAEGVVVIQIDGKSYTGNVAHDHGHSDHAEHDH